MTGILLAPNERLLVCYIHGEGITNHKALGPLVKKMESLLLGWTKVNADARFDDVLLDSASDGVLFATKVAKWSCRPGNL
jgi:hypothetical protein